MRLEALELRCLRVFAEERIEPEPGINVLEGANGAGKTTILEAIALLGRGRSFRDPMGKHLLRSGCRAWSVVARAVDGTGRRQVVGLRGGGGRVRVRVDGRSAGPGALPGVVPVLAVLGESYLLVEGPPAVRRELLDWGVFHVEPRHLGVWRRYRRALRQRNAALRAGDGRAAAAWEGPLAEAGMEADRLRRGYVARWEGAVREMAGRLLPGIDVELALDSGWTGDDLREALAAGRGRDLELGATTAGPHRADLRIRCEGLEARWRLSRGQARRLAYALVLGQAVVVLAAAAEAPVLVADEFGAELDEQGRGAVLETLASLPLQAWLTTTVRAAVPVPEGCGAAWFHVEPGRIERVL